MAEASLSVTLPAFGDNQLLRQAVASVVAQDVPTWTLQVFDDGPADPALEQWLRDLDPRVRYTWNPTRLGLSRNFQQCLDAADSGLVTIMGADDLMAPAFVRRMLDAARRRPEAVMYQPRVQVIDGEGRPAAPVTDRLKALLTPSPRQVLGGERLAISLLRGNWLYFPAMVFRTADARTAGFRQGRDIVVDLDLYLRLLLTGGRLVLVDEELFRYRRHEQSLSSIERLTGSRFLEEKAFFGEMVAAMREHGWSRAGRAARVHLTSRLHAGLLVPVAVSARNRDLARALVRHTIGRAPTPSIPS